MPPRLNGYQLSICLAQHIYLLYRVLSMWGVIKIKWCIVRTFTFESKLLRMGQMGNNMGRVMGVSKGVWKGRIL